MKNYLSNLLDRLCALPGGMFVAARATGLILGVLTMVSLGISMAQDKPTPTTTTPSLVGPTGSAALPAPSNSIPLSPTEQATLQAFIKELSPLDTELGLVWRQMLSTDDEVKATALWYKARELNRKSVLIGDRVNVWLAEIRKTHNCLNCNLEGDKLVRPSPTPTPTTQGK